MPRSLHFPRWETTRVGHAKRREEMPYFNGGVDEILHTVTKRFEGNTDTMSLTQVPLTIIVAATTKNGIGKNGALPWPMLKKEMAYFARVTKRVPMPTDTGSVQSDATKQSMLEGTRRNVVIMGRKTWDSIPPKFRPLKDRTNIVITSQARSELGDIPEDVVVASSVLDGLQSLEALVKESKALPVGRAFVIGGTSIYKAALDLPNLQHILLTRIRQDYECDTFLPVELDDDKDSSSEWQKKSHQRLEAFVGESIQAEPMRESDGNQEVEYEFCLYEEKP